MLTISNILIPKLKLLDSYCMPYTVYFPFQRYNCNMQISEVCHIKKKKDSVVIRGWRGGDNTQETAYKSNVIRC